MPDNMVIREAWPVLNRWCAGFVIVILGTLVVGCVAQQADVVRIKRELDAKITQLDKSKTSLQQAVADANTALEKANILIARQRTEIQELLHARAEVMDQVATLKDTDLSQVRGGIEQNQHLVGELGKKFAMLDTKVQTVESNIQESNEAMQPLIQELRTQLTAEEQLRAEQGGKLGEFRTSLVDYQEVLTTLRQNVTRQEQQVTALQRQTDQLAQQQGTQHRQVQADFKGVQQQIQSVIGTFEQISTTFSGRLDAYEQTHSQASHQSNTSQDSSYIQGPSLSRSIQERTTSVVPTNPHASLNKKQELSIQANRISQDAVSGSAVAYDSSSQARLTSLPPSSSSTRVQKIAQDERTVYQKAFSMLRAKNYRGAAKEFSGFLRIHPDSPLAANSQYWLGECFYGQRRFQEAIDEFERVFTFYSTSNKVPASLLKIGYSHLELQQPSMARSVFQQLVRTYPQSQAAIKAHGRLQEVNARLQNPS